MSPPSPLPLSEDVINRQPLKKVFFRYLHFLRHYHDERLAAGYHRLDKSKLKEVDREVENLLELEDIVSRHRGRVTISPKLSKILIQSSSGQT